MASGRFRAAARSAFAAVAVAVVSTSASGQAARDTASAADTLRPVPLDPVVIRALPLPGEIRTAPYAAARNGPDVTRRARPGLSLTEPLHGIAGVQVDNRFNFSLGERLMVRGFGARTQFGIRGIRVVVDGIPATMPDGQSTLNHLDLGMIESVEVVRTPLAALYGNAAGGVIAMYTAPAPDAQLVSRTRVVTGSQGLRRLQTGVAGTTGTGTYSLNVGRLSYDGFRAHNTADNRYLSARTTTDLGETRLTFVAHQVSFDALNPGALPDSMLARDRTAAFPGNVAQRTGQSARHAQFGVTIETPLVARRLTISTWALRRTLENPIPPRIIDLSRSAGGARIALGPDAGGENAGFDWSAGIEAAVQRDDRRNFRNAGGERAEMTLDQEEDVTAAAAFFVARARIAPQVEAQFGLRRDATRFAAADRLVGSGEPDDSGERTMRAWSPSVGVSVEVTPLARAFANIGTAFETPTTTELANQPTGAGGFNPDLEPQRTLSYEIGVNGATRRGYYQAALYRARVKNALVPFEVPGTPGRQFFRNAASAVHRGAELMAGLRWNDRMNGRLAYTYTDPRYREYIVGGTNLGGNRIPGVAPHRIDALAQFAKGRVFADWEAKYHSRVAVNDENNAHSPAYVIHTIRGGVQGARWGMLELTPFAGVENVLARRYNTAVAVNAIGGRYFEPGPGRTFYLGADLRLEAIGQRE